MSDILNEAIISITSPDLGANRFDIMTVLMVVIMYNKSSDVRSDRLCQINLVLL